jgi:hypothetical protein
MHSKIVIDGMMLPWLLLMSYSIMENERTTSIMDNERTTRRNPKRNGRILCVENESIRTKDGPVSGMRALDSKKGPLADQTQQSVNSHKISTISAETHKSSVNKSKPSGSYFSFV